MLVSHEGLLHRSVRGWPAEPQSGPGRAALGGKPLWGKLLREIVVIVVINNIIVSHTVQITLINEN